MGGEGSEWRARCRKVPVFRRCNGGPSVRARPENRCGQGLRSLPDSLWVSCRGENATVAARRLRIAADARPMQFSSRHQCACEFDDLCALLRLFLSTSKCRRSRLPRRRRRRRRRQRRAPAFHSAYRSLRISSRFHKATARQSRPPGTSRGCVLQRATSAVNMSLILSLPSPCPVTFHVIVASSLSHVLSRYQSAYTRLLLMNCLNTG